MTCCRVNFNLLCFTFCWMKIGPYTRHEGVGRRGNTAPFIHKLSNRWMRVVSFCPGRFTPVKRPSGTHPTGHCGSPDPVLAFCSCQESNHDSSDIQTEAYPLYWLMYIASPHCYYLHKNVVAKYRQTFRRLLFYYAVGCVVKSDKLNVLLTVHHGISV
jgi:hypothetical protein